MSLIIKKNEVYKCGRGRHPWGLSVCHRAQIYMIVEGSGEKLSTAIII